MAIFIFTDKILRGEPIQVFNHGKMKRDFAYIDDIIAGTRSAIDKNYKREIINLGNHRSEQLMDVVSLIEENLGKKAKIEFLPMQPGDVSESFADIDKSKNLLGFQPKTDVEKGIKQFIQWYFQYFRNQN